MSLAAIAVDGNTLAHGFVGHGLQVGVAAFVAALALAAAGVAFPYIVLPRIMRTDSLTVRGCGGRSLAGDSRV